MDNNIITILKDEFESDKSDKTVPGITIIIDGKLKEVMDLIIKKSSYNDYVEIIRDSLINGLNMIIKKDH